MIWQSTGLDFHCTPRLTFQPEQAASSVLLQGCHKSKAASGSSPPQLHASFCVLQEETVMKQVAIPRECYTGSSSKLFDFLATQLADFIREQEEKHKVRMLRISYQ